MADHAIKLGELIGPNQVRDAIHVAIAPVVAGEDLRPGEHVGFVPSDGTEDVVGRTPHPIGIIDPYLKDFVRKGERFWLFLYPNTVTGMRHHWQHPAFEGKVGSQAVETLPVVDVKAESEKWLRDFADRADLGFGCVLSAASDWIQYGDYYTQHGSDSARSVMCEEFWKHYEIYTGETVPEEKRDGSGVFSCSC